jgi:5'-nucleotidase
MMIAWPVISPEFQACARARKNARVRVLVTNDDGVLAPGLAVLAAAAVDLGHDVVARAPVDDRSGASAALGPLPEPNVVRIENVTLNDLPGITAVAVEGPPALAVILSCRGAFGDPPDLVLSGVNPGANTGRGVLHSGTVGAALAAGNQGRSALAISLKSGGDTYQWDTARAVAREAITWLASAPAGTVLNVNVPDLPLDEVRGVRGARLAHFGTVRTAVASQSDTHLQIEFRDVNEVMDADTDTMLVREGFVAVTVLHAVSAAADLGAPAFLASALGVNGQRD